MLFWLLLRSKNPVYLQYQANVFTLYMPTWFISTSTKESVNPYKIFCLHEQLSLAYWDWYIRTQHAQNNTRENCRDYMCGVF